MKYVLVCQDIPGRVFTRSGDDVPAGQFLKSYDPEAHGGEGYATWTHRLEEAMKFEDQVAAFKCYLAVPETKPTRDDGKPNRPLTTFTVMSAPESDYR